jgi:hypothetical protein
MPSFNRLLASGKEKTKSKNSFTRPPFSSAAEATATLQYSYTSFSMLVVTDTLYDRILSVAAAVPFFPALTDGNFESQSYLLTREHLYSYELSVTTNNNK